MCICFGRVTPSMSICFGRATPMDGVTLGPTLVSTVSTQSLLIPNSTMPLGDTSNCQAGYE